MPSMHFENHAKWSDLIGWACLALGPNYHVPVRWGRKKSTITSYKIEWYFCSFYIQVLEKILLLNHMLDPFFNTIADLKIQTLSIYLRFCDTSNDKYSYVCLLFSKLASLHGLGDVQDNFKRKIAEFPLTCSSDIIV